MHSPRFLALVSLAASAVLSAQTSAPRTLSDRPAEPIPSPDITDKLQLAPPQTVDYTVRRLAGHVVYGPKGERIGTIKDFVIEKQTGRVVYAVISSGGVAGLGDTLKLIPIHALLTAPAGATGFSIRVSRADFDRVPALIDEAFDKGLVIVSDANLRLNDEIFGPAPSSRAPNARNPVVTDLPRDREAALAASPWLRATQLRGKDLRAGAEEIGEIEDLVLDLRSQRAHVLVDLEDSVLGGDRRILVPLTELSLADATREDIATHYTRSDFVQLDPAARDRADRQVLPTGRDTAATTTSPEATLASAARSARQALDTDPELGRANIQVTPENGMLILRGRVRTEQLKDRAESAVKDAASGIRLQNYLVVDPR